ncbi:hypothetical protein [Streptomyces sp. CB03911]|uniref:hypothetical protein n=1 Tax=Streptomyces sp. CB03911 TaxID=1804758 RepID=UPI00093F6A0F|nr:hypothetical protein [Streptomyces sp. CB03911]OKI16604.1 hypothetical protein A6A07_11390 [Streptomyces sp. CB03911]
MTNGKGFTPSSDSTPDLVEPQRSEPTLPYGAPFIGVDTLPTRGASSYPGSSTYRRPAATTLRPGSSQ